MATVSTLSEWALAHPAYALGLLLGFVVGVLWALDGWFGSPDEKELQGTFRTKHLLWVAGGAALGVIGDVNKLQDKADKTVLLLYYLSSAVLSLVLTVGVWGLFVAGSRLVCVWQRRTEGYPFSEAVGDYFYYGYRYFRRQLDQRRANNVDEFYSDYAVQMAYAVTAAGGTGEKFAVAQRILGIINEVVKSHHRDRRNAMKLRSNIMVVTQCTPALREVMKFAKDPEEVRQCLHTVVYNAVDGRVPIALPLPTDLSADQALRGAPLALLSDKGFDVIDDTASVTFPASTTAPIQKQIKDYFKARQFKSVASVVIIGRDGKKVGVMNLEAESTCVFGRSDEDKERIANFLRPFTATLGIIFSS